MNTIAIRAIIVDDEPLARSIIREYLHAFDEIEIVAECGNAHEAYQAVQEKKPDIMFLDIQMPEINGFELIDMLDELPRIIFSTAYDQYAIRAFEINAVDYLLKPYDEDRFQQAVLRAVEQVRMAAAPDHRLKALLADIPIPGQYLERILIKEASQIIILSCREISWIEAMDDYIQLHTKTNSYLLQHSITYLESRLSPDQFLRAHRSYIVNIDAIRKITISIAHRQTLVLKDDTEIPLSRSGITKLKRFSL
jgi:two-component system, LytTR family, response regulator